MRQHLRYFFVGPLRCVFGIPKLIMRFGECLPHHGCCRGGQFEKTSSRGHLLAYAPIRLAAPQPPNANPIVCIAGF
jgi:hypothetical protein